MSKKWNIWNVLSVLAFLLAVFNLVMHFAGKSSSGDADETHIGEGKKIVLENILWLEPAEGFDKEGLLVTIDKNANRRDPMLHFLMNDRSTQAALFYCSVFPLTGGKLELKFAKQQYKDLGINDEGQEIQSDIFYAKNIKKDDRNLIFVKPYKLGSDILEISSPDCEFSRRIFLQAEELH